MKELILLVMLVTGCVIAEGCDIMYVREPASMAQCNPYSRGSDFQLQCIVQAPATAGPRLDIVWLFTNTSGHTKQINMNTFPTQPLVGITSQNRTVMNGELIEITSTLALGEFSHPIHAGRYFCQVLVDGLISSLSPSNAQTYTAVVDIFNESPCGTAGKQFNQAATRCAGNISFSTTNTESIFTTRSTSPIQPDYPNSSSLFSVTTLSSPTNATTTNISTVNSQSPPRSVALMWVYVLVGVAVVFLSIIIVLIVIIFVGFYLKSKPSNRFTQSLTEPDVVTTTNTAYGTSEGMKIDVNEAYEVTDLHRNDAYQQHCDAEYAEITNQI